MSREHKFMSKQLSSLETAPRIGKELEQLLEHGEKTGNFNELKERLHKESQVWNQHSFQHIMKSFDQINAQRTADNKALGLPDVELKFGGSQGTVDQIFLNGVEGDKKLEIFETTEHRRKEKESNFRESAWDSIARSYNPWMVDLQEKFQQRERQSWVGGKSDREVDNTGA